MMKNHKAVFAAFVILLAIAMIVPVAYSGSFDAAVWATTGDPAFDIEDCDGDGYNDHPPYQPVPWRGYDTTRGDPYTFPADWDGQPGSYYEGGKTGTTTGGGNTGTSGNTNNSGNTGNSGNNGSTSSTGSSSTGGTNTPASNPAPSGGNAADVNTPAPAASDGGTGAGTPQSSPSGSKSIAPGSTPKAASSDVSDAEKDSALDDSGEDKTSSDEEEIADIVAAGGAIDVELPEGEGALHPGGKIVIRGAGFAGDVKDLEIEIHSSPKLLDKVSSGSDGSFELTVLLPDDLEAGSHNIVVLYKGNEIVSKGIEVVPAETAGAGSGGGIPIQALAGIIAIIAVALLAIGVKTGKIRFSKEETPGGEQGEDFPAEKQAG
ncbi:MAG: IPT/TIG domain-containing protein [Clostridiales Family XIII bacterium]|nr:IPT/TIG domain-containing protein [Clostridiales Family XIII bacterium]